MAASTDTNLGLRKIVSNTFPEALENVTAALAKQGFGILSDIDVAATLQNRINKTIEPYRILGACNPNLAYEALSADRDIGLLLPCNVVVREVGPNEVEVHIANPEAIFSLAPERAAAQLADLPGRVEEMLAAALATL